MALERGHEVEVSAIPNCDLHPNTPAVYDANLGQGWANVCQHCFDRFSCRTGVGLGQKLILRGET